MTRFQVHVQIQGITQRAGIPEHRQLFSANAIRRSATWCNLFNIARQHVVSGNDSPAKLSDNLMVPIMLTCLYL